MAISLTGNDTHILNGRNLTDFADGDVVTVTFSNDSTATKKGKNNNSIISPNEQGRIADVELRILRGSADDKFINQLLATQKIDLPSFNLMTYNFSKRIGDGDGNVQEDSGNCTGGVFSKHMPDVKENVEGDTDQAVAVYMIRFADCTRTIG